MIKAAVFDLDGTLMNTLTDLHIAVNRALAAFSLPAVTTDKVRASVGNGVSKLIERCLDFQHKNLHRQVLERFNAEYALCKEDNTAPFEGVTDTLSALKRMRIAVAVVSNKTESAVKSLCGDEFGELVDIAVGDDGVRPLKPDPAPVLYALEKFGRIDSGRGIHRRPGSGRNYRSKLRDTPYRRGVGISWREGA